MASEKDLIRRGDVLELLYRIKQDKSLPKNYGTLLTIIDETWKMPTVDAVEVVHAHIITTTDKHSIMHQNCSACGEELEWKAYPNYCPNYGADMRGEKNASD